MGDIAKNFNRSEFTCKCGCGRNSMNERFVEKLQTLRDFIGKPINITSGYRCNKHDKNVGGTGKGTHTLGIACDLYINGLTAVEIAERAEKLGFGGIGIIDKYHVHIDMRDETGHGFSYSPSHWYGNEATGENNIKTFVGYRW